MKVILLKDDKTVGRKGQVIEVAEGYARNYLFPRGIAIAASEGNVRTLKESKDSVQRKEDRELSDAKRIGSALDGLEITVKAKTGENGRLFGSITKNDVAEAILKRTKLEIDRRRIVLDAPIKAIGTHLVTLHLHPQVEAQVTVHVEGL